MAPCRLAVVLLLWLVVCDASHAEDPTAPPEDMVFMGRRIARTMHYLGAPWLVRDSREREEEPAKLIGALGLKPGMRVCDLGCGNGFYSLRIAEKIQPRGLVYAVDIQEEMLDMLAERAKARQVTNVKPILGEGADPKLPEGKIDLLLLVDVYHEIYQPGQMLKQLHKSLAPKGRVALIEFRGEDPKVPIKLLHKMTQQQCMKEFTANGFKLVGQFDELPRQHMLFFARADSPLKEKKLKAWKNNSSTGPLSRETQSSKE